MCIQTHTRVCVLHACVRVVWYVCVLHACVRVCVVVRVCVCARARACVVCVCVPFQLAQQLTGFHKTGTNVTCIGGRLTPYLKFLNKIRKCEFLTEQDYYKMYRADTS